MLAYTYKEKGKFVLEEKEKPEVLKEQDAIVRVTLASICSSHIRYQTWCSAKSSSWNYSRP